MINYQALRPFRNHDKLDRHLQQTNDKLARSMYRGYLGFAQILILAALATTLTPLLRPVMSAIMDFLLSV